MFACPTALRLKFAFNYSNLGAVIFGVTFPAYPLEKTFRVEFRLAYPMPKNRKKNVQAVQVFYWKVQKTQGMVQKSWVHTPAMCKTLWKTGKFAHWISSINPGVSEKNKPSWSVNSCLLKKLRNLRFLDMVEVNFFHIKIATSKSHFTTYTWIIVLSFWVNLFKALDKFNMSYYIHG